MLVKFTCALTLIVQVAFCRPSQTTFEDEISQLKQKVSSPALDKRIVANEVFSMELNDYNKKIDQLKHEIRSNGKTPIFTADLDTCKELKNALDNAHTVSNDAAILSVKMVADLSDVVIQAKDCLTINPFVAVNCAAHRMQDGRDVYNKYKPDIDAMNVKLLTAFKEVFSDLFQCFRRINS